MKIKNLLAILLVATTSAVASAAGTSTYPSYPASSPTKIGLGLATTDHITGSPTSLTAAFDLHGDNWIQTYFAIPATSPFQFGVAALFKHTIVENMNAGIHVGGGIGLGDVPGGTGHVFAFAIDGVVGIHFAFPGASSLRIDLDAGPSLRVVDGNSNFSIDALSPALGLSVLYFF